jgi:hypothetical protein
MRESQKTKSKNELTKTAITRKRLGIPRGSKSHAKGLQQHYRLTLNELKIYQVQP